MSNNAYIKLVPGSAKDAITTEEVKELFNDYKEITAKTGKQTGWKFDSVVVPYDLKEKPEGKGKWFYLESNFEANHERYSIIMVGVDKEQVEDNEGNEHEQYYVQLTLPKTAAHGDKGKAIEFAKFLAKKLQGELHLFNERVMYYNKRK